MLLPLVYKCILRETSFIPRTLSRTLSSSSVTTTTSEELEAEEEQRHKFECELFDVSALCIGLLVNLTHGLDENKDRVFKSGTSLL
jgi:hypothetical protein